MSKQIELQLPQPATWTPPRGRHTCGRDPAAGPGSCFHWWGGCEKAEKLGCYLLWWQRTQSQVSDHK